MSRRLARSPSVICLRSLPWAGSAIPASNRSDHCYHDPTPKSLSSTPMTSSLSSTRQDSPSSSSLHSVQQNISERSIAPCQPLAVMSANHARCKGKPKVKDKCKCKSTNDSLLPTEKAALIDSVQPGSEPMEKRTSSHTSTSSSKAQRPKKQMSVKRVCSPSAATFDTSSLDSQSRGIKRRPRNSLPTAESMSIRPRPRASYLQQASETPQPIESASSGESRSEGETTNRKLVLLDLNGTLLYRTAKSKAGSIKPIPRPFLDAFLRYCLGENQECSASTRHATSSPSSTASPTMREILGTHFYTASPETFHSESGQSQVHQRSLGACELIVWSSAQPANVDAMLLSIMSETQRARLLRVWARNTLVPTRFYDSRVQTTKDLEIAWHALNLTHDGCDQGDQRIRADDRDRLDNESPDGYDSAENEIPGAAGKAAQLAEAQGPWNAKNTVLLDDTPDKARLQPFNHLLLSEFGEDDVKTLKKLKASASVTPALQWALKPVVAETADAEAQEALSIIEAHDSLLLQMIGVLQHACAQVNVAYWIKHGGLTGYGGEVNEHVVAGARDELHNANENEETRRKHSSHDSSTKEEDAAGASQGKKMERYWIEEGLKALHNAGIETSLKQQMIEF
ncbi:hypothetical protein K437DRAFT_254540 [Tilletiaria anomala UBC 951]|uniref:FCP1 homology domain-containing protein n=1 Tax=Tilletiaria anomala (strain ATCC 24038 / CBS 436.72 / UBC 951) TaxID=1037660 RepID=A0A066WNF5_TILAU|nr:uncharacterized protein K437DRAFT_254540 [Tilletiaria anomala UBC 951]KDN52160.1 hypothetical protein K437DRAFT_254540 [Tilletiaria anomala UBC 951]